MGTSAPRLLCRRCFRIGRHQCGGASSSRRRRDVGAAYAPCGLCSWTRIRGGSTDSELEGAKRTNGPEFHHVLTRRPYA